MHVNLIGEWLSYLPDDFLLQIECGTDNGNSVSLEIASVSSTCVVHGNKLFKLYILMNESKYMLYLKEKHQEMRVH